MTVQRKSVDKRKSTGFNAVSGSSVHVRIMIQNNIAQDNSRQFNFNFNFNFFFGNRPEGPKSKFPIKRAVAWIVSILTLLTGGAVQAPLVARPVRVEIVSPANGTTLSYGSSVPLVARVTTEGVIKRVEFHANGVRIGKAETHIKK